MALETRYSDASFRAKQLVKDSIAIDTMNCVGMFVKSGWAEPAKNDRSAEQVFGYFDRAIEAGITAMGICQTVDPARSDEALSGIAKMIDGINRYPDKYLLVRNSHDIHVAHKTGRLGLYFVNQGSCCFDENPELIGVFRQMGLGFALLAQNTRFRAADGCYESENGGLTSWGKMLIDKMISAGMPIDVTHVGIKATREAMEYSQQVATGWPVIYSHTGLKRHLDHVRAATDENGKLLVEIGGVMNVCLCNPILTPDPTTDVNPQDAANAIDCAVQYLGIDHVGIATDDFEEDACWIGYVKDMAYKYGGTDGKSVQDVLRGVNVFAELAKKLPAIVDCLIEKGYTDEDVKKVIGGNMMRMIEKSWDVGVARPL